MNFSNNRMNSVNADDIITIGLGCITGRIGRVND